MKSKMKNIIIVSFVGLFWFSIALFTWINPPQEVSESERRKLAQLPKLDSQNVFSGKYMNDFEEYAKDQFPKRFQLRTLKAYTRFYLFQQKDNNDIYIQDGFSAKLEYPLNENSIETANKKFQHLYDKYMKGTQVKPYISVVPDKSYFIGANKGYPSMNYDKLFSMIKDCTGYAKYIDITDKLTIDDYYKTDIHWRQENLKGVAKKIGAEMGIADQLSLEFQQVNANIDFYGVYYGQSALPLKPDKITYLTNDTIKQCKVYNAETGKTTAVYDTEKLGGKDPYDVYLSGATPLLVVENPNAKTDQELIVFRDSFGSSLIPLLLEGYSKVTIVDIRYINSDMIGNYIEFSDQDVLLLYSTSILNNATILK